MKKIFTLLFTTLIVTSALAQSSIIVPSTNYDYSFVTVGCNRVDYLDTAATSNDAIYSTGASTANVYQLKRLFTEISQLSPLPKFLIMTGDIVMGYKTPSTPDTTELAKQLTAWKAIYESHPLSTMGITLIVVPGNHETQDKAAGKKSFFAAEQIFTRVMAPYILGSNGPGIGGADGLTTDQSKLTYSFNYGGDHYIMMNTDPVGKDNQVPYKWLAGDIQYARANSARHIFVFGHKPAYSSPLTPAGGLDAASTLPQRDSLWKYLEDNNCEAMFSAHEHLWDTIHPHTGKTWQVIAGNGGSRVEPAWAATTGPGRQYYGYTLVNLYTDRKVNVMGLGRNTDMTPVVGSPFTINEDANPTTVRNNFNICLTTTSTTNVTANNSYVWNGVTYNSSGTYTKTGLTNAAGCDSIATLILQIIPFSPTYVIGTSPGVLFNSILTANDSIGGYKMSGIPDGLGAFDNGNGTFTLLINHEITSGLGVVRAHGSKGAFVSKWIINKSDLKVTNGEDLMKKVNLWDIATSTYTEFSALNPSSRAAFSRFCSADLPPVSAFYNSTTGLGTQERIFMNGEENNDESRAMAHIVTGANGGTSWELPALGKAAWENAVATPNSGNKTVVGLMNDGTDGQVYFYIGTKTNTGTEVDKAGLTNGTPWGVKVTGFAKERVNSTTLNPLPAIGTRFSLVDLGVVKNITGVSFNANSNTAGITSFSRPEDGAWDPSHPNDFYFNTTDQLDQVNDGIGVQVGRTRVWRLRFDDVKNPETGGTIEAVLDGTEGPVMLDNMAINKDGHIILLEDVGNAAHNGKVWDYNIAKDSLRLIGKHDPVRFGDIGVAATAPFTVDEETSGVIDMQDILGAGKFLIVDQAHYTAGIPVDIVEGGQLLELYNPYSINQAPAITITNPITGNPYNAGGNISFDANATDVDGIITKVEFYNNAIKIGEDLIAPYSFAGDSVEAGNYVLTAKATDNNGAVTISNPVTITVTGCTPAGSISAEGYTNIPGSQVSDLTGNPAFPNSPSVLASLNIFEYGVDLGADYGARVRGYICAPQTGYYTFYIAADDQAGLWLSKDENPVNKVLIAYAESFTNPREWFKFSTQKSVSIKLIKGVRYYIETLHKELTGSDHLAVAWALPDGTFEGPIQGSRLSPYTTLPGSGRVANFTQLMQLKNVDKDISKTLKVTATPNPATNYFTLVTTSGDDKPLSVNVTDVMGRVVERRSGVAANSTLRIGYKLAAGVYVVEVIQGTQKVMMKLMKK